MRPTLARSALKIRLKAPEQAPSLAPFVSRRVRYSRNEQRSRTLTRQWNLDHIVPHAIPLGALGNTRRRPPGIEREEYFVHFDDRVKFWNIAPGDRVMIADAPAEERGKVRHVAWVDRTRNHIGLYERDCRIEDKRRGYFRGPEEIGLKYKLYEYTTVRLMKPGSEDVYYEDLRETDMTPAPSPRERGRKKLEWTRTGVAHSTRTRGPLTGVRERIPWPPKPKWDLRAEEKDDIERHLQEYEAHRMRIAPTDDEMDELQKKLDAMSGEERDMWKEQQRREKELMKKRPYGGDRAPRRSKNWEYLYTDERTAWQRTFTSEPYQSADLLWLSQDPTIRARFPELFARPASTSRATSSLNAYNVAQSAPQNVPELAIPPGELTAGWHTARGKLKRFESSVRARNKVRVATEVASLLQCAANAGEEVTPQRRHEIESMVARLNRYHGRLRIPFRRRLSREERRKERVLLGEAKHVIGNMKHKYEGQKVRAALDLLPLLERYNTEVKRGGDGGSLSLDQLVRAGFAAETTSETTEALGGASEAAPASDATVVT